MEKRSLSSRLLAGLLSTSLLWNSSGVSRAEISTPFISRLTPPAALGRVTDVFQSPLPNAKRVILIQDLHTHTGVQKNIADLLDFLSNRLAPADSSPSTLHSLPPFVLATEGAQGPVDSSVMALFPDRAIREQAADYLMHEGELTGVELFGIRRGIPSAATGVENITYYQLHRELFRKTQANRAPLVSMLKGVQVDLQRLERSVLSRPVRSLYRKQQAFEKGELTLNVLRRILADESRSLGYRWEEAFPSLARFEGDDTSTPAGTQTLHDVSELGYEVAVRMAKEGPERSLVQVQHDLALLIRVANVQATELDVKDFGPRLNRFVTLSQSLLASYGLLGVNESRLRQLLSSSVDYYALALMRNAPMVNQTLALMDKKQSAMAVLVAGGFHTAGMAARFRQLNVSYAVITPEVGEMSESDSVLYVKRLQGRILAVDDILSEAANRATLHPGFLITGTVALASLFAAWAHAHGYALDLRHLNLLRQEFPRWSHLAGVTLAYNGLSPLVRPEPEGESNKPDTPGPTAFSQAKGDPTSYPNEDNHFEFRLPNGVQIGAVLDGVGGLSSGEEASAYMAAFIERELRKLDFALPTVRLVSAVQDVLIRAQRVLELNFNDSRGTTVTLAIVRPHSSEASLVETLIFNGGDSRAYAYLPDGELKFLTVDNAMGTPFKTFSDIERSGQKIEQEFLSRVASEDELSQATPYQRVAYRNRNIADNMLVASKTNSFSAQITMIDLPVGTRLLLTTDGVHDNLTHLEIAETLAETARLEGARALVEKAHARSQSNYLRAKGDDITALEVLATSSALGPQPRIDRFEIGEEYSARGHRIAGGASRGRRGDREIIVVDWDRDPELQKIYDLVLKRVIQFGHDRNELSPLEKGSILEYVLWSVMEHVTPDVVKWDRFSAAHAGQEFFVGDVVREGGVCRHMGIVSAALLERLIEEGILHGQAFYIRGQGHGWAVYRTSEGRFWVFDAMQQPKRQNRRAKIYTLEDRYFAGKAVSLTLAYGDESYFPKARIEQIPLPDTGKEGTFVNGNTFDDPRLLDAPIPRDLFPEKESKTADREKLAKAQGSWLKALLAPFRSKPAAKVSTPAPEADPLPASKGKRRIVLVGPEPSPLPGKAEKALPEIYRYSGPIRLQMADKVLEIRSFHDMNEAGLWNAFGPDASHLYFIADPVRPGDYVPLTEGVEVVLGRQGYQSFRYSDRVSRDHVHVTLFGGSQFRIVNFSQSSPVVVSVQWKHWIPLFEHERHLSVLSPTSDVHAEAWLTRDAALLALSASRVVSKAPRSDPSLNAIELVNHFRLGQALRAVAGVLLNGARYALSPSFRAHLMQEMEGLNGALSLVLAAENRSVSVRQLSGPWYRKLWEFGRASEDYAAVNLLLPREMKLKTLVHEVLHVFHPDWTESQVIGTTDHYVNDYLKKQKALPQTVMAAAQAETAVGGKVGPQDLVSIIPTLLSELHLKPKEATSVTAAIRAGREAILHAA